MLSLERATVGYSRRPVLRDVTLRLYRGQFTALFGANGSGKSTLLKTLVGILPPLNGSLHHHTLDQRHFHCGYVPQREMLDAVYPLSALDVVLMGTLAKCPAWQLTRKAHRLTAKKHLDLFGLAERSNHPFASLSIGQQQRVIIARALATNPDFLAMDEPTSAIDRESVQAIFDHIEVMTQQHNLSVLIVSHKIEIAMEKADHILQIEHGRLTSRVRDDHIPE